MNEDITNSENTFENIRNNESKNEFNKILTEIETVLNNENIELTVHRL